MPVVGRVYDHRLNGARGTVHVLGFIEDIDEHRTVWVSFRYLRPRPGAAPVQIMPVVDFGKVYVPQQRPLEAVRS